MPDWMTAPEDPKLTPYEAAFKRFVQGLPCICCGHPGPSTASHVTLNANQKGTGMKVDHLQVVPHCEDGAGGCHPQWEERRGRFVGWSKDRRYEQAAAWVYAVHGILAIEVDDKPHALDLQAAELGTVTEQPDGTWSWLPAGPVYAPGHLERPEVPPDPETP